MAGADSNLQYILDKVVRKTKNPLAINCKKKPRKYDCQQVKQTGYVNIKQLQDFRYRILKKYFNKEW